MNVISKLLAAVVTITTLSPVAASAHEGHSDTDPALGKPASVSAVTRTVSVNSGTRAVNVEQGDIVRFDVNGKTFVWQFDTLNARSFELAKIAPEGIATGHIRVYVADNPIYRN